MEKFSNAIKCVNCSKILSSPILLPCGDSVCKAHIDEASQSCACHQCDIVHSNCAFSENKALSAIIESRLTALDFSEIYTEAKMSCEQLNYLIAKTDIVLNDTEFYVHEMFDEMRQKIDLKYEESKLKLEQEAQKSLSELNSLEHDCIRKIKDSNGLGVNELTTAKETAQKELNSYVSSLNDLKVNENKWKSIQKECAENIKCLQDQLSSFNESLTFSIYEKLKSCDAFTIEFNLCELLFDGRYPKIDSKIITDLKMKKDLINLCEFDSNTNLSLLYRGSRDGFKGQDFHSKCDHKLRTLTIVKSTSECIFGGYTEADWYKNGTGNYQADSNAYLFSLINKENEPVKMEITASKKDFALCCNNSYGPVFGEYFSGWHELCIYDNSNLSQCNDAGIGNTYKHPRYQKGSENANNFFAGSTKFQVAEIEVFQLS